MFSCDRRPSDVSGHLDREEFDRRYVISRTVSPSRADVLLRQAFVDGGRFEFVKFYKFDHNRADLEMEIACELNALRSRTPCFAYCTGWNLMGWDFVSTYEWSSQSFQLTHPMAFMFLVIHALAWAIKHFGSFHFTDFILGDRRGDAPTIRGEYMQPGEALSLALPGVPGRHVRVRVEGAQIFVPRLLNMGIDDYRTVPGNSLENLRVFMLAQLDPMFDSDEIDFLLSERYREAELADNSDYGALVRLLTESPAFRSFVTIVDGPKRTPFHGCDELPSPATAVDDALFLAFRQEFRIVKELGMGSYGYVVEVHDFLGHSFALKLASFERERAENEIYISCHLPHDKTPVFTRMHGWLHIASAPDSLRKPLYAVKGHRVIPREYNLDAGLGWIAMISDLNAIEIQDEPLDPRGNAQCLFMLLHGLAWARLTFGHFRHRDIKANNIMLVYREDPDAPLYLPVPGTDDEVWQLPGPIYAIPKFIDLGLARVTPEGILREDGKDGLYEDDLDHVWGKEVPRLNDLSRLHGSVFARRKNAPGYFEMVTGRPYLRATYADRGDYETLVKLLDQPYFQPYAIRGTIRRKRQKHIGSTCAVCFSSDVTRQLNVNSKYTYCDKKACTAQHEVIKSFIPSTAARGGSGWE
jgi:serine/threonine protein kinase